jgi:hypothetical protein
MSNRFYEVGWDVEHLLNVISEIIGALVVVLLHGPSSIHMFFLQWSRSDHCYPWRNYLDTATSKRAIRPLDLEILRKERQQSIERTTTLKEHKRKDDLALSVDVRSLGQRNTSGDLLSTNLGLSLTSTSRVDRVDLYVLIEMA